jgi:predicted unusual protein kinase regulating ubiquinone biosynthesis (AarF/ABC1/UbiB family)
MAFSDVHERTHGPPSRDKAPAREPEGELGPILAGGPRKINVIREQLASENGSETKASFFGVTLRLAQLVFFLTLWVAATQFDRMLPGRRRELHVRAAARLRRYIERMGGTLIKLGQQASLRSDLLSEEYCDELAALLDRNRPFAVRHAYRAIEEQTGRPWRDSFALFDENPVGSASIACVYRAFLHSGEEVAVKVRRPGIYRAFANDLAALSVVSKFLEFFMFVAPGLLDSFVSELRTMLLDELDFRSEVRHQELFRRYLGRRKKLSVTAPKIYYRLSGPKVIVSEFVSGFWMDDIVARLVAGDRVYLAMLRRHGIDPHDVARRLIRSQYYQFHECPFFHGDPHPGNILVRDGGEIVMVDFGACGVFSARDRNLMLRMNYHYTRGDVTGMVHCVLNLMEPLPHIDVDAFSKYLQDQWWKGYYGIKSRHADWSERTSFRLWVALLRGFRQFCIPMPLHMIRMVRATLLYDTVAAQLYPKINVFTEFEKYYDGFARRVRVNMQESVIRQLLIGPDDQAYVKARRIMDVGDALLFRAEKFLAEPEIGFEAALRKVYQLIDAVVKILKAGLASFSVAVIAGVVVVLIRRLMAYFGLGRDQPFTMDIVYAISPFHPEPQDRLLQTIAAFWLFFMGLIVWSHVSRMLFRFKRKDLYPFQHRVG